MQNLKVLYFVCFSLLLGLVSVFLLGYTTKEKLDSSYLDSMAQNLESKQAFILELESKIKTLESKTTTKNTQPQTFNTTNPSKSLRIAPIMPPPPYLTSFVGKLSYEHAIKIAQEYLDKQVYEDARIWIYRAYELNKAKKEAWELYVLSFELADKKEQQDAKDLFKQASFYYGF